MILKKLFQPYLSQTNSQYIEQPIAFMSQSLFDSAAQYSLIEKYAYSLVKAVENFLNYILGKHIIMKFPLPLVKFLLSINYLSEKLANWLTKIQEHDLTIETVDAIKGRCMDLHLAQIFIPLQDSELEDEDDPNPFIIDSQFSDLHNHDWYSDILYYLNHEKCP